MYYSFQQFVFLLLLSVGYEKVVVLEDSAKKHLVIHKVLNTLV